jgi:hypothetical protein
VGQAAPKTYLPIVRIAPFCPVLDEMAPAFGRPDNAQLRSLGAEAESLLPSVDQSMKETFGQHTFPALEPVPTVTETDAADAAKFYRANPRVRTALLSNEIKMMAMLQGWLDVLAENGDPVLVSSDPRKQRSLCLSYSTRLLRGMAYSSTGGRSGWITVDLPYVSRINDDPDKSLTQFGILAHELGHFLLEANGVHEEGTRSEEGVVIQRSFELKADCLAGLLVRMAGITGEQADTLAEMFASQGVVSSTNESIGSQTERHSAFIAGLVGMASLKNKPLTSGAAVRYCVGKIEGLGKQAQAAPPSAEIILYSKPGAQPVK